MYMSMKKICVLTGASRGIGEGILRGFADHPEEVFVIATATSQASLARIENTLESAKISGSALALDCLDTESVQRFCQRIDDLAPQGVSYLVHNAAVVRDQLLLRMKQEDWDSVLTANLSAVFAITKHLLKGMMRLRCGRVVCVSSVSAALGTAGQCNYAASKAGLEAFSRSVAREFASRGITSNCVAPGFINTGMSLGLTQSQKEAIYSNIPLRRMGEVNEVVHAVMYLLHPHASYVTGSVINVNGGLVM